MSTDWVDWHAGYADPDSDLSRRRRSVQAQVVAFLDSRSEASLRVVSACAGDGRDLLEVLARRPDAQRVTARLLETDERLAAAAVDLAASAGLPAVDVRRDDAGCTGSLAGAVPADLVMMCGVFGNVSDDDLRATVAVVRSLAAVGATVLWTRGTFGAGDATSMIRGWFAEEGFEELGFDAPADATYRVGTHRLVASPTPFEAGRRFFTFTR